MIQTQPVILYKYREVGGDCREREQKILNPINTIVLKPSGYYLNYLVWVRFFGYDDGDGKYQEGWKVSIHDEDPGTLTIQPECLFTMDGIDLYTREKVNPHYQNMIKEYMKKMKKDGKLCPN
jgi:hypothetical protein